MNYILLIKGKRKWFFKIMAPNGQTVLVSQHYYSRWNAKRAAKRLASINKFDPEIREFTDRG